MAALLIVAHAPLATALREVARHVFPDRAEAARAVDVAPDWTAEQAEAAVREAMAQFERVAAFSPGEGGLEVLILADVFGATPCNAAQRVADGVRCRLLAGVNVPMLWRALAYLEQPLDCLAERALGGGSQGVLPASAPRPQDQPLHSQPHDSSQRHHQQ